MNKKNEFGNNIYQRKPKRQLMMENPETQGIDNKDKQNKNVI
jgi:hypothetical protein